MKQNFAKLATLDVQYMYFMHEIIVSLANHDNPKKSVPNCGMWALTYIFGFFTCRFLQDTACTQLTGVRGTGEPYMFCLRSLISRMPSNAGSFPVRRAFSTTKFM